nr:MAG TPA: hypothetical protein [Caudoviricetes sp.]
MSNISNYLVALKPVISCYLVQFDILPSYIEFLRMVSDEINSCRL